MKKLTNRFHVAVRLFSNRSQMTSKCGKNKKVAHEAIILPFSPFQVVLATWLQKKCRAQNMTLCLKITN